VIAVVETSTAPGTSHHAARWPARRAVSARPSSHSSSAANSAFRLNTSSASACSQNTREVPSASPATMPAPALLAASAVAAASTAARRRRECGVHHVEHERGLGARHHVRQHVPKKRQQRIARRVRNAPGRERDRQLTGIARTDGGAEGYDIEHEQRDAEGGRTEARHGRAVYTSRAV
jgi:hypothetical protein